MEIEDFAGPEIAVTAALTAAVCSPRAHKAMRKGLVYGIAGVLTVGDMVTSLAKSVGQSMQKASSVALQEARNTAAQAQIEEEKPEGEKTPGENTKGAAKPAPATRRKTATKPSRTKTPAGAKR